MIESYFEWLCKAHNLPEEKLTLLQERKVTKGISEENLKVEKEVELKDWIMIESDATTSDTVKSKEMDNFHFSKMGKDVSGSEIKLFREAIEKLTSPHKDSSFYEG